jgi:hypothetical protein
MSKVFQQGVTLTRRQQRYVENQAPAEAATSLAALAW